MKQIIVPPLYKYITYDACLGIFNEMRTRWSSPLRFNDPFDTQIRIPFGDEEWFKKVKTVVKEEFLSINQDSSIKENEIETAVNNWISYEKEKLHEAEEKWPEYAKGIRILCLSETFNNLLMWAHYTHNHEGAVLKFRKVENGEIKIQEAHKVNYLREIPRLSLATDNFISFLQGEKDFDYDQLFFDVVFTKSIDWSYEKEWRCLFFIENKEDLRAPVILKRILPEEIEAIYLGCNMSSEKKRSLIGLVKSQVSGIKIFEANKNPKKFALNFTRIS